MRNTILFIFGVLVLKLFFSCEHNYSSVELKNNFSPAQISDLEKIKEFFRQNICSDRNLTFKDCYYRINHDSLVSSGHGIDVEINFEEQKKLYNQISNSTFKEIWRISELNNQAIGKSTEGLDLVTNGKYLQFLVDLGKKNSKIEQYANKIQAAGTFLPQEIVYWEVLEDHKHFNLDDPNIQLVLAIDYLTKNDLFNR